jgi:hypothetical protein
MGNLLRSITIASVVLTATISSTSVVHATTYFEVTKKCPIGGQKFKTMEIGSSSSWGQRPDGRSYGTLPIWPLQVCPKNGFVIFDEEFSKDEISQLTLAIAEPEYVAMTKSESAHYRAAWLARKVGRPKATQASFLMQAGWDSEDDVERKRGYQAEFAAVAESLALDDVENGDHFWLGLRGVNALRELGQFDKATARLEQLKSAPTYPLDADEKKGADYLIAGLSDLIADKNDFAEPTNLIPRDIAEARCKSGLILVGAELRACEKPVPIEDGQGMTQAEAGEEETGVPAADAAAADAKAAGNAAGDAVYAAAVAAMKEESKKPKSGKPRKRAKPDS